MRDGILEGDATLCCGASRVLYQVSQRGLDEENF
jgi:hypothetical protein